MRPLLRVLVLCLPLLTIPAMPINAAASAPSIFPPTSVFVFSQHDVGGPTKVEPLSVKGQTLRPIAETYYDVTNTDFAYEIDIYHSLADAKTYSNLPIGSAYTAYNVPQPFAPDEQLVGRDYSKNGYYVAEASSVFRNLYLTGEAFVNYSDHPSLSKEGTQALTRQEALAMLAKIYVRAKGFAAHPFHASPTKPSLAAARQARNQQMVALEKQLDTLTHDCQSDFGIVGYLLDHVLNGNPSESVSGMEADTQYGIDSCNTAQSRVDAIRLSSPLNQYSLVHRLLSAEHTEMFDSAVTAIEFQRYLTSGDSGALNATEYAYKGTVNQDVPAVSSIRKQINTLFGISPSK